MAPVALNGGRTAYILTAAGALPGYTSGGTATADRRAIYYFLPDGDGSAEPTYNGDRWPIVYVPQGATITADPSVTAIVSSRITTRRLIDGSFVEAEVLLVNGRPAYQYSMDTTPEAANGNGLGDVWFWFEESISQEELPPPAPSLASSPPPPSPPPVASPPPRTISNECPAAGPACTAPSGQDWVITTSCTIQAGSYSARKVLISDGAIVSVEQDASVTMDLSGGLLVGSNSELWIGCESTPFTGTWTLTFNGRREDLGNTERWLSVDYSDYGLPPRFEVWANALVASHGARLEIHGAPKTSWTRLREDAGVGATTLTLEEGPVGWAPGDEIVIAGTGVNGGSERATVASVAGDAVTLQNGLTNFHEGSWPGRGARLNGEVGMLSHNVRFTSGFDLGACENAFGGTGLSARTDEQTKDSCFGGNVAFLQHSIVHVENAEFSKLGQALVMGRYSLHFHLAGDASGSYLRGNGIHHSNNRCIVLHGVFNAELEGNVCVDNRGHNLYLEDGIEVGNAVVGNLVVNPRSSATICTDKIGAEGGAAGIWITNPNNTFTDNAVVGAAFGAWFTFPTVDDSHPFTGEKRGQLGGVFGASAAYFRDPLSGYGPAHWVVQQEQTRTPVAAFHRNTFKDSARMGITVDFRVHDSEDAYIPCLDKAAYVESSCPTCANVGHTFSWGPATYDVSAPPAQREYQPAKQTFEDIIVAYTRSLYGEGFSYWATGGLVSFERSIFVDNQQGSSLGFTGECASGIAFGRGGANVQFSKALFLNGPAPFKLYDGGYHCVDCRWAGLDHLVTMRPGSPGNVNGVLLERSAPLGWIGSDRDDPLLGWIWDSNKVSIAPAAVEVPNLVDWTSGFIQNSWQGEDVNLVSTDGLGGTVRGGAFTQWVRSGNPGANQGWGYGAIVNEAPRFKQFYPCMGNVYHWCGDGRSCEPHAYGRDVPGAPWL